MGYLIPETLGRRVFQLFAQLGGLAWTVADFITFLCVCVLDSRQEHVSVMFQVCGAMRIVFWKAQILVCDYTCPTRETPCDELPSKSRLAEAR